jgi:hypothetical protein
LNTFWEMLEGEPKNLKGNQWRVLRRVISIQSCTFSMAESMGIHGGWRGGKREERVTSRFGRKRARWMSEEREDGGVKGRFHLLWPHGLLSGDTGQTGDPQGPASEALSELLAWGR